MNRTTLELPRTRAKRPPPRTVEVIPGKSPGSFTLLLRVGSRTAGYACQELNVGSTPGRGFTLVKLFGGADDGQARYDVLISSLAAPGEGDHCDCTGFRYHGHCKHADAVRQLIALESSVPRGTV